MKKNINKVLFALIVIGAVAFISCKDNDENTSNTKLAGGTLTYDSGCKGGTKTKAEETFSFSVEKNTLFISKRNAMYECGVNSLQILTNLSNDTIYIVERWLGGGANCVCLRDVDFNVPNIPEGYYTVKEYPRFYYVGSDTNYYDYKDTVFNITIQ